MYKAKCTAKACQFQGVLWRKGQLYEGSTKPPHHFEIISGPEDVSVQPDAVPEVDTEEPEKAAKSRKKATE